MKLWIARDKDFDGAKYPSRLNCFEYKPIRLEYTWNVSERGTWNVGELPAEWFPEVTWENSPQEVEFKLINNGNQD